MFIFARNDLLACDGVRTSSFWKITTPNPVSSCKNQPSLWVYCYPQAITQKCYVYIAEVLQCSKDFLIWFSDNFKLLNPEGDWQSHFLVLPTNYASDMAVVISKHIPQRRRWERGFLVSTTRISCSHPKRWFQDTSMFIQHTPFNVQIVFLLAQTLHNLSLWNTKEAWNYLDRLKALLDQLSTLDQQVTRQLLFWVSQTLNVIKLHHTCLHMIQLFRLGEFKIASTELQKLHQCRFTLQFCDLLRCQSGVECFISLGDVLFVAFSNESIFPYLFAIGFVYSVYWEYFFVNWNSIQRTRTHKQYECLLRTLTG